MKARTSAERYPSRHATQRGAAAPKKDEQGLGHDQCIPPSRLVQQVGAEARSPVGEPVGRDRRSRIEKRIAPGKTALEKEPAAQREMHENVVAAARKERQQHGAQDRETHRRRVEPAVGHGPERIDRRNRGDRAGLNPESSASSLRWNAAHGSVEGRRENVRSGRTRASRIGRSTGHPQAAAVQCRAGPPSTRSAFSRAAGGRTPGDSPINGTSATVFRSVSRVLARAGR